MPQSVSETDFHFPHQTALYHGKVRDVYSLGENRLVMVATDRISAFDHILPRAIPYKGQVLNQLAAHLLEATADIVPNWLRAVPDPNVSIGVKAEPVKVEMVIRGVLVGHAWREYEAGKRELCGVVLPEDLKQYDAFPEPIITPTTKADEGHDEDIAADAIIKQGLATAGEWRQLSEYAHELFKKGQAMARERGLVLADTKYEFGRHEGQLILIDEVHTPDSSRYFYAEGYDAYVSGDTSAPPRQLSKEFVREWLMGHGFSGQTDQTMPQLPDEFVAEVSARYIELYEQLTGQTFVKAADADPLERIAKNVKNYLETQS
ncbi:MAG TPA: phosphoribosylaminoimidazolesuccinocarboxamide synthase [Candidatus Saccharimonadales bacterium]